MPPSQEERHARMLELAMQGFAPPPTKSRLPTEKSAMRKMFDDMNRGLAHEDGFPKDFEKYQQKGKKGDPEKEVNESMSLGTRTNKSDCTMLLRPTVPAELEYTAVDAGTHTEVTTEGGDQEPGPTKAGDHEPGPEDKSKDNVSKCENDDEVGEHIDETLLTRTR